MLTISEQIEHNRVSHLHSNRLLDGHPFVRIRTDVRSSEYGRTYEYGRTSVRPNTDGRPFVRIRTYVRRSPPVRPEDRKSAGRPDPVGSFFTFFESLGAKKAEFSLFRQMIGVFLFFFLFIFFFLFFLFF